MKPVYIQTIGIMAPGLVGWEQAQQVLSGSGPYQPDSLPALKPEMLKPNERRRTSNTIKLALQSIQDGLGTRCKKHDLITVFTSSEGDMEIVDKICRALDSPERPVSPTHFHNSVHNAPAGYAGIAAGSQSASTSLAARAGSFASGLLEAAVQAWAARQPVLLVAYDYPVPYPLSVPIPITRPFATALLLSVDADADTQLAVLNLRLAQQGVESRMQDAELEVLRLDNPAARSLPILQVVASGSQAELSLPYLPGLHLTVEISPC
ncbi:MAG: beta-ketoacyl synthase chain length factor [Gammaproteobacteria bacterium]|nr:beta-ketoacyl synthase chain length factor [Gammaproteobacteria bacterium]